ncbi:hypothetical protein ACSBR2_007128 [Camellia fascicularis]
MRSWLIFAMIVGVLAMITLCVSLSLVRLLSNLGMDPSYGQEESRSWTYRQNNLNIGLMRRRKGCTL